MIAAYVEQDIVTQCRTAVTLARQFLETGTYPASKYTYCPSSLTINPLALE